MTTAVGDIKYNTDGSNAFRSVCLLTGQLTTNGAPSASTDGVPVYRGTAQGDGDTGASFRGKAARESVIQVASTAGSGTMSCSLKLWGYLAALGKWMPLGTNSTAASKGLLNAGDSIGETSADQLAHAEPVLYAGLFDRLYLEVTAIGGTATALQAWITTAHRVNY